MKRILAAALFLAALLPPAAMAQSSGNANVVATCGTQTYVAGTARPVTQNTAGNQCTAATATISGTVSENLAQVNGQTVNVGTGAAGTGTQRVTTSTDSTIGTVTTVTNPVGVKGADGSAIASITNGLPTIGIYKNVSVIPTVQNAAYAAGQSLGGLQTLTVLPNGLLQQVQLSSQGGSTVGVWVYAWNKSPASTTCTDRNNFVRSQTDNQNLIAQPFLLTPALGVSAQDATTYATATNLAAPFVNNDTSPGSSIYVCLLAAASVTPGTTSDYRFNLQAAQ